MVYASGVIEQSDQVSPSACAVQSFRCMGTTLPSNMKKKADINKKKHVKIIKKNVSTKN